MNYLLKHVGLCLVAIGALLLIVGTFLIPDVWYSETPCTNWYLYLILIFEIGGLILHYVLNSRLPLEAIEDDEDDQQESQTKRVEAPKSSVNTPVEVVKNKDKEETQILKPKAESETTKILNKKA